MLNHLHNNSVLFYFFTILVYQGLNLQTSYHYLIILDDVSYRKPVEIAKDPSKKVNSWGGGHINNLNWGSLTSTDLVKEGWIRVDLLDIYFVREVIIVMYPGHANDGLYLAIGKLHLNSVKVRMTFFRVVEAR